MIFIFFALKSVVAHVIMLKKIFSEKLIFILKTQDKSTLWSNLPRSLKKSSSLKEQSLAKSSEVLARKGTKMETWLQSLKVKLNERIRILTEDAN